MTQYALVRTDDLVLPPYERCQDCGGHVRPVWEIPDNVAEVVLSGLHQIKQTVLGFEGVSIVCFCGWSQTMSYDKETAVTHKKAQLTHFLHAATSLAEANGTSRAAS